MSDDVHWLIEAIQQKQLVYFENQFRIVKTIEPRMYAKVTGNRHVMIGYQIDGGGDDSSTQQWVMHELPANIWVDPKKRFSGVRPIPKHFREMIREVYAEASSK